MNPKISIRISNKTYKTLQAEAKKRGVSFSEALRLRLNEYPHLLAKAQHCENSHAPEDSTHEDIHPVHVENNYLLRGLALDRNSQILDRADKKMARKFPKYGGLE